MNYNSNAPTLNASLGISDKRFAQLNHLFALALTAMPPRFSGNELHSCLAAHLNTPEEAYLMGSMVALYLKQLDEKRIATCN